MEAVEFIRTIQKMCKGRHCDDCPLKENYKCNVIYTEDPEESVRIVEEWAKEQESEKPDQERQKPDQERQKPEQDNLEGAIYRAIASNKTRIENFEYDVSVIRHNLSALHDKIYALSEKVGHTTVIDPDYTNEPKQTNKDVLLAAFPRIVMDGDVPALCPRIMDRDINFQHCAGRRCYECRHEYWLSEAQE